MSASLKRMVVGSLAALAIGVSAMGMTTPAFAQMYQPPHAAPHAFSHGGGGGGGGGGHWHGGGGNHWHGGGGGGWGPAAVGLGVLGLAAGAAIAAQPGPDYYDAPAPYDDGCQALRPTYDAYGNFIGRRWVNVC